MSQHQRRNGPCASKIKLAMGAVAAKGSVTHSLDPEKFLSCVRVKVAPTVYQQMAMAQINWQLPRKSMPMSSNSDPSRRDRLVLPAGSSVDIHYESEEDMMLMDDDEEETMGVDTSILDNFNEYREKAKGFITPIRKKYKDALELMAILRETKASLDTYDSIMDWHLKATGVLHQHEGVGGKKEFVSRDILFKYLAQRYNMHQNYGMIETIVLPSSKASVKVIKNDAKLVLQSLLTDPRIKANDYLFHGNDPFMPPPNDNFIGDLNTGKAYIHTYNKLITKPNQVLLPIIIYIDGTATGQFADLPVTAVKITLGIFTREAREKPHCWRILGYIPKVTKANSRGRRLFLESFHVDATRAQYEAEQNEGQLGNNDANPAQDLHTMLDVIFEELVQIQNQGFIWDLYYNNNLYKGIEFVPFVPFIKADTEEADRLCGSYTNRNKNVAQLCRYCECPTDDSDNPMANYRLKTMARIQKLVDQEDLDGLKRLSQQCIENATYKLRFGLHNALGVHSATPLEMLHALLLGIFKYVRDIFFEQTGESSTLSTEINALASELGRLMHRQSDRDKPKSKFCNGIRKGKLMAKEYTGVLLCLLLALRSAKGHKMLRKRRKFFDDIRLRDWVMLLETLLQWEEWLKSAKMMKKHVRAARQKHRYIMFLMRKIANRSKGMGLKLTKFHAIVHMSDDMLNFGVPLEFDTGSDEKGHRPTKTAAKLTQKTKSTFDEQVAQRLREIQLLEYAMEESKGRCLWDYRHGHVHYEAIPDKKQEQVHTGGAAYRFFVDNNGVGQCDTVRKNKANKSEIMMETAIIDFMLDLNDAVNVHCGEVQMFSEHKRRGKIFRANASYRKLVWRDWVWVDWGTHGVLPNKIWGFVDLRKLPANSGIDLGGLSNLEPAIYAIVESSSLAEDAISSELVEAYDTDCEYDAQGRVTGLTFYLADVEAFKETAIVVPDIGGPSNRYLVIKSRANWRDLFIEWLESDPKYDIIDDLEDEDSATDEEESSSGGDEEELSDDEDDDNVVSDTDEEGSDLEGSDSD